MKKAYEVNGTTVATLGEVAEVLDVNRVTGKEVEEGKYPEVKIVMIDAKELTNEPKQEVEVPEGLVEGAKVTIPDTEDEDVLENLSKMPDLDETVFTIHSVEDGMVYLDGFPVPVPMNDVKLVEEQITLQDLNELPNVEVIHVTDKPKKANKVDKEEVDEVAGFPPVGYFDTEKDMKKYIKGLTNSQLAEWLEEENIEYTPNDHESINRMRMAMAIKALHFPDTAPKAGKSKKKSKYGDYSTDDLVQMALDNDVEVADHKDDMRILRMYTIVALRKAGILE